MERATPSPHSTASAAQVKYDNAVALRLCWANKSNAQTGYNNLELCSSVPPSNIFHTMSVYSNASRSLELQVPSKVSEFALSLDGPGNLLIVYYTGFTEFGHYCFKQELNKSNSKDEMVWVKYEKVLRMAAAHIL
ncbi:MAG: hypothetical protein Q9171_004733 [Xanthocarpia ochracea]